MHAYASVVCYMYTLGQQNTIYINHSQSSNDDSRVIVINNSYK